MSFEEFVRQKTVACLGIVKEASKEFAADHERTFNFEATAQLLRENPRLRSLQTRDVAAVHLVEQVAAIVKGVSVRDELSGQFTEAHNYLYLMEWLMLQETKASSQVLRSDLREGQEKMAKQAAAKVVEYDTNMP